MDVPPSGSDQSDIGRSSEAVRASGMMRSANGNLRRLSDELGHSEPTAFFCECRDPDCYSVIWASVSAFDTAVEEQSGWLLVDGHVPSRPWRPAGPPPIPPDPGSVAALRPARSIARWGAAVRQRLPRGA